MAGGGELPPDEAVRRSVARTVGTLLVLAISLAILGAWASLGYYSLQPGEHAIIFRLGRYVRTEARSGPHLHLPPPIGSHEIVSAESVQQEHFGFQGDVEEPGPEELHEATMQTSDNNIVLVGFAVQYKVKDAFESRYRVASPRATLRDAAQAAVRQVVARHSVDGVLSEKRGQIEVESRDLLQSILDRYHAGLDVLGVELQRVQPPDAVRDAFDDVIAAIQDRNRAVNEAQGYANEVLPRARAEAQELLQRARGYKEARVAEATGEARRFEALLAEYAKAPEVTRTRLYLEALEDVLGPVEKVLVDPEIRGIVPYLPLAPRGPRAQAAGGER